MNETPLTPYAVPAPSGPVDLWLDKNEGAEPPASLLDALVAAGPRVLARYPDARPLEALLAGRLGVTPDRLLVTAGADEALDRVCRTLLAPGREMVLPEPTFEMLPRYARLAGGEVLSVPWTSGPYPVDAVLARVTPQTALVVVVTPNNPTGAVATAKDLERLAAAAPRATLLVDLAYTELADEDLTSAALALPNAVITRTLSKGWGLAGLRVGYIAGPAPQIQAVRITGSPYGVTGPSLLLAEAWLTRGERAMRAYVDRIRTERRLLANTLEALGASPSPSQANFVLARFADAAGVQRALGAQGIAVRIFPNRPGLEGCLRITCPGDAAAFERLTQALQTALSNASEIRP
jgi:histidinol-phosphate aminotransferase